jgi:hypothetical protein
MRAFRPLLALGTLTVALLVVAQPGARAADQSDTYITPWVHPLFFKPFLGWRTGKSGNTRGLYGGPVESTAWIAKGVDYTSPATADPPNATLAHLPANAVIVWAVTSNSFNNDRRLRLNLRYARHLACCDGPVAVVGGVDELTGYGPHRAYSVIIRAYYGSTPTAALRAEAQRALRHLALPAARFS